MTYTAHTETLPTSPAANGQHVPISHSRSQSPDLHLSTAWQPALQLCCAFSVLSQGCTDVARVCLQTLPMVHACPVLAPPRLSYHSFTISLDSSRFFAPPCMCTAVSLSPLGILLGLN